MASGTGTGLPGAGDAAGSPNPVGTAASSCHSKEAIENDRKALARKFYEDNTDMNAADIQKNLEGIDFSKPVEIVEVPPEGCGEKGDQLCRLGAPGSKGQYFSTNPDATPDELGMPPQAEVRTPDGGRKKVEYEKQSYSSTKPMKCLKSTAAPIKVTWVDPPVDTRGGGTQYFAPLKLQDGLKQNP